MAYRHIASRAIATMSAVGVLDCQIIDCAVVGNTMYEFVQNRSLPHLIPFDGGLSWDLIFGKQFINRVVTR